jgi:hypothetical protein
MSTLVLWVNWSEKSKMADKIKMAAKHEFSIAQKKGPIKKR